MMMASEMIEVEVSAETKATQNTDPRKCYRRVHSCTRCGHPIEVGQMTEPWLDGPRCGTRYNWVHQGCGQSLSSSAKPVAVPPQVLADYTHAAFNKVMLLAKARKNIFLPGPAGCGKTHLAAQVAEALGLEFRHISCSGGMSEGQLTGRLLPVGDGGKFEYVESDFVHLYENGGVFLLDEIDAADPNVMIVINSALANGKMSLPNRPGKTEAKRHPDFVVVAAANTFGRGCDRLYVGRAQLDESTLDRFRIGTVPMEYDPRVERVLCPDENLRNRLVSIREKCLEHRLQRIVSSRFLRDAYDMLVAGFDMQDIEAALFSGWAPDEVRKVK